MPSGNGTRRLLRYSGAALLALLGAGARLAFLQHLQLRTPFLTFFPVIFIAALVCDFGGGMIATFLSALLADYFWIEPVGHLYIRDFDDRLTMAVFVVEGLLISWATRWMHRAQMAQEKAQLAQERLEAGERLRESEQRLRLALEGGEMGMWEWDIGSNRSKWNRKKYQLMGLPEGEGEISTNAFFERIHPEDAPEVMRELKEVERCGCDFCHEFRIVTPGGEIRWLAEKGRTVCDASERPSRMVGVTYDITQRKLAEEERDKTEAERRDELERRVQERTRELLRTLEALKKETEERIRALNALHEKEQLLMQQSRPAAMGEMISNIAHQWRQPLNAIALIVQELPAMYRSGGLSEAYLKKSTDRAMEIIAHMSHTIDDFRNFFIPDREKVPFRVKDMVTKTVSLVEESFRNQQIKIELEEEGEPTIYGYPNEYSQVLLNIFINARDAFVEKKQDKARTIKVTIRAMEGKSVVSVADNAGGIPEGVMEKIFDPYFTTKGADKGTGIGLFMAKTIVEKNMKGTLSARNVADGAEFTIEVGEGGAGETEGERNSATSGGGGISVTVGPAGGRAEGSTAREKRCCD